MFKITIDLLRNSKIRLHHQKVQPFFHETQSSNLEFLNSLADKVGAKILPYLEGARHHSPRLASYIK